MLVEAATRVFCLSGLQPFQAGPAGLNLAPAGQVFFASPARSNLASGAWPVTQEAMAPMSVSDRPAAMACILPVFSASVMTLGNWAASSERDGACSTGGMWQDLQRWLNSSSPRACSFPRAAAWAWRADMALAAEAPVFSPLTDWARDDPPRANVAMTAAA